jgi:hypothetical protein
MEETDLNYIYIDHQISIINNLNKNKLLNTYKFNNLYDVNYKKKILFILIKNIFFGNLDSSINYKLEYFYDLLEFIIDNLNILYEDYNNIISEKEYNLHIKLLFKNITNLNKGQYLLLRIKQKIYEKLCQNDMLNYAMVAASYGTIATFLFWLNKSELKLKKLYINAFEDIIVRSISNSDDRIFKYLLNDNIFINIKSDTVVHNIIKSLGSSSIPVKYILKRLKLLNEIVNLIPYFDTMITSFTSAKVLLNLHKYYFNIEYTLNKLYDLINIIYMNAEFQINIIKLFNYLKTDQEKSFLIIILNLKLNNNFNLNFNIKNLNQIIINNSKNIVKIVLNVDINKFINNNIINNEIFQIITKNNLIANYYSKKYYNICKCNCNYLLYTRFFYPNIKLIVNNENKFSNYIYIIANNLILHNLRLYAKRFKKIKFLKFNFKMYELHNDIKNFKSNDNIPVLKKGTYKYQIESQQFLNIKSKYIVFNEINNYNTFLLKKNYDGIHIDNLPLTIYPHNSIISNYQIKGEFVEKYNLYLISDINIPDTTIIERYYILRNLHSYTKDININNNCDNIYDFLNMQNAEEENINLFLNNTNNFNIKWYPKFAAFFNFNKNIINQNIFKINIIDLIKDNNIKYYLDLICLNNFTEFKIKSRNLLLIKLLYNGTNWIDNNNTSWDNIIINNFKKIKKNQIYNCYFNNNNLVILKNFIYNKTLDSSDDIKNIINQIKYLSEYNK